MNLYILNNLENIKAEVDQKKKIYTNFVFKYTSLHFALTEKNIAKQISIIRPSSSYDYHIQRRQETFIKRYREQFNVPRSLVTWSTANRVMRISF